MIGSPLMLVGALSLCAGVFVPQDNPSWQSDTLTNGVAVTVIHAPGAERQSVFTMLPHGLSADSAGKAQWAHLLEHLAIRSTDPLSLHPPGMEFNGETSAEAMRLDAYVDPEKFDETLARQVAWLTEWRTLEKAIPETLEREKGVIAQEMENTVRSGYAHKWADAAWAQVVFHGATHARVSGDVMDATVEELQAWRAAHPTAFAGLRVVTVGPLDAEEAFEKIEAAFGALDTHQGWRSPAPPPLGPDGQPLPETSAGLPQTSAVTREATWDLPATHLVDAFFIPGEKPEHRLAAVLLSQALMMESFQQMNLRSQGVQMGAGLLAVVPQGTWIKLSTNVPEGVELETVQQALDDAIQPFTAGKRNVQLGMQAMQFMASLTQTPDFEAARRQAQARGIPLQYLEGNLVLPTVITEWQAGADRETLAALKEKVGGKRLPALATEYLVPGRRERLVLRPGRQD